MEFTSVQVHKMGKPTVFTICLVLIWLHGPVHEVAAAPVTDDVMVTHHSTWAGGQKVISGDLIIAEEAHLNLEGIELLIGGQVHVQEGAALDVRPYAGRQTIMRPLDPEQGWWMEVDGTLNASGVPRTIVEGLNGDGLDVALYHSPGGLRINGTASLENIIIRNGSAGVLVGPEGRLSMQNGHLDRLGLFGLTVLGRTDIRDSSFANSTISVTAKGQGCDLQVIGTRFTSGVAHMQIINCPTTIQNSLLGQAQSGIVVNGETSLVVQNTTIHDYDVDGIRSDGRAEFSLDHVRLDGQGSARHGLRLLTGNTASLQHTTITNHTDHGILLASADVQVQHSLIAGNGGFGLRASTAYLQDDWGTVSFAGAGHDANERGTVSLYQPVDFFVHDEHGPVSEAQIRIIRGSGETIEVLETAQTGLARTLIELRPADEVIPPHSYEVTKTGYGAVGGDLDLPGQVTVPLQPAQAPAEVVDAPSAAPLGLLALLLWSALVRRRY